MNLQELKATTQALRQSLQRYERIKVCCHSCEHYGSYGSKQCAVHKATPPPEWVTGPVECADWQHDGVPW